MASVKYPNYGKMIIVGILLILCLTLSANAQLYRWVDENGVTHFSNTAPPQDDQFNTHDEAISKTTPSSSSSGLDQVINSYKKDSLQNDNDSTSKSTLYRESSDRKNESAQKKSEDVARLQRRVDDYKAKLKDAERESYSDKNEHEKNIRHYKNMVSDYEAMLEKAKLR